MKKKRAYRMTARADAAAETYRRLVEAGSRHLANAGWDDLVLADVAGSAGVTVQTLLRRFGSKEGLFEVILEEGLKQTRAARFSSAPGDVPAAVDNLLAHYEAWGERSIKLLAQEDRSPAARKVTTAGRQLHADWVDTVFAPQLGRVRPPARARLRARLIAVTDVYTWKVLRRDLGLGARVTRTTLLELVNAVLA